MKRKSTLAIAFATIFAGFLLASCASAAEPSDQADSGVTPVAQSVSAEPAFVSDPSPDAKPAAKIVTGPAKELADYRQECSRGQSGKVKVTLGWLPSWGGQQWLDISLFPNGFAPGTFIGIGPFSEDRASFDWDGLVPGRIHYFRVNTLSSKGWEPSETLVFKTGRCQNGWVVETLEPDFAALQQRLQAAVDNYWSDGQFAVAVTDLQTGDTIGVNSSRPQLSGCVMNWFVILQSVLDVQNGTLPESEVGDLIATTIWGSVSVTARQLYEIVGGGSTVAGVGKVSRLIASLGLLNTIIDHPPGYDGDYSLGVNSDNWITATDANKALAQVYWGQVLELPWRDYLLEKMEGVKPGLQYLIGSTPGGIVSHKNGFFASSGYIDNDIGIVRFNRGSVTYAYAISFFSQDVPSKYADISLGQDIIEEVWQYFSTKYQ